MVGAADVREVPHAVRRARSDLAGSVRGRAAVEVELVRAPLMAVPLATVHAEVPTLRAPDAHAAATLRRR